MRNQAAHLDGYGALREREHADCVICSPTNERGLGLDFTLRADGSVRAEFACREEYVGYPGRLHGGVISALLDGAMTNCLFAHGIVAYTAELTVRYRHSVEIGEPVTVTAWCERSRGSLHVLRGEIAQTGAVRVTGAGKFLDTSRADPAR